MAKGGKNLFAAAAEQREKEQQEIQQAVISGGNAAPATPRTNMTISLSADEKMKLKTYAARKGKTAASIVQGWIAEFCNE